MSAAFLAAVDSAVNDASGITAESTAARRDAKLQQMFHRFVTGSDKSEVDYLV